MVSTVAHWFAANASARLVLTARTPLPPREEWARWLAEHGSDGQTARIIRNIREIEESGGEVLTAAADAADLNQMKCAIDLAREHFGVIDGVVHAAGVPGDRQNRVLEAARRHPIRFFSENWWA